MTPQLNLVVIRSADLQRAASFYERLGLAFTKHRHGSGPEHLACENGPVVFEIYARRTSRNPRPAVRIGFRVPFVDAVVAELQQSGTNIVAMPKDSPWGRRAVVVDPDGHRVELIS